MVNLKLEEEIITSTSSSTTTTTTISHHYNGAIESTTRNGVEMSSNVPSGSGGGGGGNNHNPNNNSNHYVHHNNNNSNNNSGSNHHQLHHQTSKSSNSSNSGQSSTGAHHHHPHHNRPAPGHPYNRPQQNNMGNPHHPSQKPHHQGGQQYHGQQQGHNYPHPNPHPHGHPHAHQQPPQGSRQGGGQQHPSSHHNHPHAYQQHHPAATTSSAAGGGESAAPAIDFKLFESVEYPFCTDHSKYEPITKIGQGTFGEVYKARCRKTNDLVALKKVLTENEKEGFPITALREIKILQVLRHENIVRLIEICTTKASQANKFKSQFYLVFEFCEHDLAGLLSNPTVKFTLGEQKKIMQQLLNGLYFIHKNLILHRDMKTANILVTKDGKLKLADFGLARGLVQSDQPTKYTNRVVTLWYRPPELLLGERCYTKAIDIWGSGCIMAELWTREPILKGNSEQNQLDLIQSLCGSISPDVWPEVTQLELWGKMILKPDLRRRVKERLSNYIKDPTGLELLDRLLTLDPRKRIDSDEALDHDFFWSEPLPCDLKLDKLASSMFEFTSAALKRGGGAHYRPGGGQKPAIGADQHYDRVY